MLTGELVRAAVKDGKVKPGFITLDKPSIRERAEQIIACIDGGEGLRRGEIDEELKDLLGDGVDQKLFLGLAKLVFDQCEFATKSPIPPKELRQKVWLESARRGPLSVVAVEGANTPAAVYAAVAAELGVEAAGLADALYADQPAEQRLTHVSGLDAPTLVARYNLAIVQALLFSAASVDIRVERPTPADARHLLRAVKFQQLCFSATRDGEDLCLHLDGPASLFSQTTRYGLSLAKFLPTLVLHPRWSLRAVVQVKHRKPVLELDQGTGLVSHARDAGRYETREAEWFAERFEALSSSWTLERDPLPLNQGGEGVVVPDFTFRNGKRVAHLEILGFWRKGTIERRLALLKKHGPKNLVLAVSKRYCTEKAAELPEQVVSFAEVVPSKQVLERIEALTKKD